MAVDTRDRRAAVLGWGLLPLVLAPTPDAGVSVSDRAQLLALYGHVDATESSPAQRGVVVETLSGWLAEGAGGVLTEGVREVLREES